MKSKHENQETNLSPVTLSATRRRMLKGAAWSAPIVMSVSLPQHAQATAGQLDTDEAATDETTAVGPSAVGEANTTPAPTTTERVLEQDAASPEPELPVNIQIEPDRVNLLDCFPQSCMGTFVAKVYHSGGVAEYINLEGGAGFGQCGGIMPGVHNLVGITEVVIECLQDA